MRQGPIIIIEDDHDDWDIFKLIFTELGLQNEILFFDQAQKALDYLCATTDQPFIIICDVNIPIMNGLEFRKLINADEYLRQKSIPFIFMSTSASPVVVNQAYLLNVQGFFEKGRSFASIKEILKLVTEYWQTCRHPNNN